MTNEVIKAKVEQMENDIKEIKNEVKSIPDSVATKLDKTIDLKIKLAISDTERKYMGKFIALLLAVIGEGIGLIISFIKILK